MRHASLADERPDLIEEWSSRNDVSPFDVSSGSNKKVVWCCKQGHEWSATVKNRALIGSGCPYCNCRAVLEGFNDLGTIHPELINEWSEKNDPLKITQVSAYSNKKAWWRCAKGHEWYALISSRSDGHGCPYCAGELIWSGFNDLQTMNPDIAAEWSEKNNPLRPNKVSPKSTKNVLWCCSRCSNEYKAVVDSKVKGLKCPFCKAQENEARRVNNNEDRKIIKNYLGVLPKLAVIYYAGCKEMKVLTDWEEAVGIPVTAYVPDIDLVIDICSNSKERLVKEYILKKKNITYIPISDNQTESQIVETIRSAFLYKHIFYDSDPQEDIKCIREKYIIWARNRRFLR